MCACNMPCTTTRCSCIQYSQWLPLMNTAHTQPPSQLITAHNVSCTATSKVDSDLCSRETMNKRRLDTFLFVLISEPCHCSWVGHMRVTVTHSGYTCDWDGPIVSIDYTYSLLEYRANKSRCSAVRDVGTASIHLKKVSINLRFKRPSQAIIFWFKSRF